MKKFEVMVGVVVPKGKEFALQAFQDATKNFLGSTFVIKESGLECYEQRKLIVAEAKKRKVKGILFFECDIIPPDSVLGLVDVDADIVGGAYLGWQNMGQPKITPCSYALANEGMAFMPVDYLIGKGIVPVAATQFGCAFVRDTVFAKIDWPETINDDVMVCQQARKKGLKVVVHAGVKCVRKTQTNDLVWPQAYVGFQFSEDTDQ